MYEVALSISFGVKRNGRKKHAERNQWLLSGLFLLVLRRHKCTGSAACTPAGIITLTLNSIFTCCTVPYTKALVQRAFCVL